MLNSSEALTQTLSPEQLVTVAKMCCKAFEMWSVFCKTFPYHFHERKQALDSKHIHYISRNLYTNVNSRIEATCSSHK